MEAPADCLVATPRLSEPAPVWLAGLCVTACVPGPSASLTPTGFPLGVLSLVRCCLVERGRHSEASLLFLFPKSRAEFLLSPISVEGRGYFFSLTSNLCLFTHHSPSPSSSSATSLSSTPSLYFVTHSAVCAHSHREDEVLENRFINALQSIYIYI